MEIKRNDIFLIAFGLVMLILISCKPKPEVSFDVDSFHKSLEEIASGVIEWTRDLEEEQKDTLNVGDKFECDRALSDSVVLREMKGYLGNDDIDSALEYGMGLIGHDDYDKGKIVWERFLSLCRDGKHKAAYEYYKDDHAGGIFAYLRHSAFRFAFESKILRPLLWEYEDDSVAIEKYINILKIEYNMEKLSVALGEGRNNYIPEQYPYVITELGYSLAEVGREEECLEMVEDLMYALYSQTGAAVSVNYLTTVYVARVYLILGEREKSVGYCQDFKDYLNAHVEDCGGKEVVDYYMNRADDFLNREVMAVN